MANYRINEGQTQRLFSYSTKYYTYTADGTAKAGSDYRSYSAYPNYGVAIDLQTYSDNIYEGPEVFWINHSSGNQSIEIIDEEDRPRLSIASQTVVEGDDGEKILQIVVNASNPAAFNYDVHIRTAGGSASAVTDYKPLNSTFTMAAGSTSVTTSIKIISDQWKDPTETIVITATSSLSPAATATITIQDNDQDSISNVLSDVLGTSRPYVENAIIQSAAAAAVGGVSGALELYGPQLVEIGGGIGTPFTSYYDEIAQSASVFKTYHGAFETTGKVVGFASVALSVVETVNVALNDVATSGELGRATSLSSARLSAAMLSGLVGEFVGVGFTATLIPMLAAGGALAGAPAVLPILAGIAVGSAAAYAYGQVFDQIAIAGVDKLYKSTGVNVQSSGLTTQSVDLTTQASTSATSVVEPDGSFGNVRIGNAIGKAAWRYDADTKQLTWLDENKKSSFDELLKFTGSDTSGAIIDGTTSAYAKAQSFMGTIGPDTITGSAKNDLILGKAGDDNIYVGGGSNLVDGGDGSDRINGGDLRDILFGGNGNDFINGGGGNDFIDGGDGADRITDWFGNDELRGGSGDDTFALGKGNRIIDGGSGVDYFDWSQGAGFSDEPRATGLKVIFSQHAAYVKFGSEEFSQLFASIEKIDGLRYYENFLDGDDSKNIFTGGNKNDEIYGRGGDDNIDGGDGADNLEGGDGDDIINGGNGSDKILGGFGNDYIFDYGGADTIDGGDGDDRIIYDRMDLSVDGGAGIDVLVLVPEQPIYIPSSGGLGYFIPVDQVTVNLNNIRQVAEGAGIVKGFEGVDYSRLTGPITAVGTPGNNLFIGTSAEDVFNGLGGDDFISGGDGLDIASYRGSRSEYKISLRVEVDHTIRYVVADKYSNRDGSDVLTSIDMLSFTDGRVIVSTDIVPQLGSIIRDTGNAGDVIYALYDGILGRAPDMVGLQGWVASLDAGVAQRDVAAAFLASSEGQMRAGAADNSTFVDQLYRGNLQRYPDIDGKNGWVSLLEQGASRADVALSFALSSEHVANLKNVFDSGIFVPDRDASNVARIYYSVLDRAPDASGLQGWTSAVKAGAFLHDIAATFLNSAEYEVATTGRTDAQFVTDLYQQVLDRAGDSQGIQGWNVYLDAGGARGVVIDGFTDSLEFQAKYAGQSSAAYVEGLYEHILGRTGDSAGLQGWANTIDSGIASRTDVAHAFTGSAEFQSKYVGPSNADFVDDLYENAFGRPADAGGLQGWTDALANGISRADVAVAIAQSAEAQQHLVIQVEVGWHLA